LGELHISFDTPADYGMHAEAVGALRAVIKDTKELETALTEAEKVQEGQYALLNVFVKD
jgi:thiamine pyrophosphate-dependent acetolactate synthase large subunit-like protein